VPGELTRTIVRKTPGSPVASARCSARHPAWIKKFILGVDTLYYMGYYGSIV